MAKKINLLNDQLQRELASYADSPLPASLAGKKNYQKKRPIKALSYIFVFCLVATAIFSLNINQPKEQSSWIDRIPFAGQLKHLAESANVQLKGEARDRINILLLGMAGKNHNGGYLTDTIMVVSLQPSTKKVALISIPRDLSVPLENMGWRKINNINAFAEAKEPGSGGLAVSQSLSDILNIPIDYYVRVDFTSFAKIIDTLNGIEVNVANTLDDYKYPILGNENAPWEERYEHLHINQGWQKMNGSLALKYARSRHALGREGSDFARAKRQQKILQAIKDKVNSFTVLLNPVKISSLISQIQDNFNTNFKIWEMLQLWNNYQGIKNEEIITKVIDNSPSGLLTNIITADGAYILTPRGGDFTEIQYLINNVFSDAPADEKNKVDQEKTTIEVHNGTWINGLANKVALDLEKYGFKVARVGNSSQQNFQKSVIYDLTYGAKIQSLTILKNKTKANVSLGLPQWLQDDLAKELAKEKNLIQPDFILVLGTDADTTQSGTENTNQ